ncbi:MAG: hypothetical protein K0S32_2688 [Bacteroidetes bacterium]|jgi:hypothetical protein|nr:hypothetical protein [Bacteroidota bacterium]
MIDGIYYSDDQFFRFYKDGTLLCCLIRVSGEGDLKQILNWFKKENPTAGVRMIRYTMNGNTINFKFPAPLGDGRMIEYTGTPKGKKEVILSSLNHTNGRKIKNERFLRLE